MSDRTSPHTEKLEEVPRAGSGPPSRVQAVRQYLADHPEASDDEVRAALAAEGIDMPADYPASVREQGREPPAKLGEAVRELLCRQPGLSDEQVAAALRAQGQDVTREQITSVRAALRAS